MSLYMKKIVKLYTIWYLKAKVCHLPPFYSMRGEDISITPNSRPGGPWATHYVLCASICLTYAPLHPPKLAWLHWLWDPSNLPTTKASSPVKELRSHESATLDVRSTELCVWCGLLGYDTGLYLGTDVSNGHAVSFSKNQITWLPYRQL
jgi:hypothetical protein